MSYLEPSPAGRRYGLFHDNPQHPAKKLFAWKASNKPLPPSVVLSNSMGYIRDQGQEGSCTGQAGAALRDYLYRRYYAYEKNKVVRPEDFKASASFIYKCNLIADGDLGTDAGSSMHQTIITLNQKGAAQEILAPYSDTDYSTPPSNLQYGNGLLFKAGAYHALPDVQSMKECLFGDGTPESQYTFIFGIDVYESFEGSWSVPGLMPMPDTGREQLLGGHAQHVFGYDDTIQAADGTMGIFWVQNSWGSSWGINAPGTISGGCYMMPQSFVRAGLASDTWMIHLGPAWR